MPLLQGMWEGLGGEQFTGKVTPFMLTLEPGAGSGATDMIHTGHEFVFCIQGQLAYWVEGQTYLLDVGDSLLFEARLKHRWHNPTSSITNALIIISDYADGDRPGPMHVEKPKV